MDKPAVPPTFTVSLRADSGTLIRLPPAGEGTYETIYQRSLPAGGDPDPALQQPNVSDLSFRWLHSQKNYGIIVQDFHFDDLWPGTAIREN